MSRVKQVKKTLFACCACREKSWYGILFLAVSEKVGLLCVHDNMTEGAKRTFLSHFHSPPPHPLCYLPLPHPPSFLWVFFSPLDVFFFPTSGNKTSLFRIQQRGVLCFTGTANCGKFVDSNLNSLLFFLETCFTFFNTVKWGEVCLFGEQKLFRTNERHLTTLRSGHCGSFKQGSVWFFNHCSGMRSSFAVSSIPLSLFVF